MKTYPIYRRVTRKRSNMPYIALILASAWVVYDVAHLPVTQEKGSQPSLQRVIAKPVTERSDLMRLIDRIEGEEVPAKPVVLYATYQPTSEQDRARVIGEIWGVKGELHETRIFTARKD